MIIKSLARKRPGFRQLVGYINRDNGSVFSRNLYGATEAGQIARAFEANHALLPKRRNGNALYHEVIVLPPQPRLSAVKQDRILQKIASRYCELRAPDNLTFGRVHHGTDNTHIHLMISANAARSNARTRLSKAQFAEIQAQLEQETCRAFPELAQTAVYQRSNDRTEPGVKVREDAMERAGKQPTRKSLAKQHFTEALRSSASGAELYQKLQSLGLELYHRGQRIGLRELNSGARYRLDTLGLTKLWEARQRDWQRARVPQASMPSSKETPSVDPRAVDLLRQRERQTDAAERTLRGFETER